MTEQELPATPQDPDDQDALAALIDRSSIDRQTISDLRAEETAHRDTIGHLTTALESSRRIGAATGILMSARRLTETQAFELLKTTSQAQNRKVRDLADDVLLTGQLP